MHLRGGAEVSEWLPILCSDCGETVGAAPAGKAPGLALCTKCIAGATLRKTTPPQATEADHELDLPITGWARRRAWRNR